MGCWLAKNPVLAGWPRNSGWLAAREFRLAGCCCRRPLSPPPAASVAVVAAPPSAWCGALMVNTRNRKRKWGKVGGMWVNSKADLAAKRHRKKKKKSQRGRDLKEFLWQMHPDQLSDRDRSRFVRREARRRHGQHGALNYKDRREARRVARRRGQDGISALADADAALADVALAEAGAASATMQHDPFATLLSSPPFRKLACAESALTAAAAAAAATADMIASDDADVALAGAALATAAAQATTAALRAVHIAKHSYFHAMNELIEKEGSIWRVDPGAAPGPALSPAPAPAPAPPWGSLRLRHGEVSVTLALFELSRRRAARIAIWDSDL